MLKRYSSLLSTICRAHVTLNLTPSTPYGGGVPSYFRPTEHPHFPLGSVRGRGLPAFTISTARAKRLWNVVSLSVVAIFVEIRRLVTTVTWLSTTLKSTCSSYHESSVTASRKSWRSSLCLAWTKVSRAAGVISSSRALACWTRWR